MHQMCLKSLQDRWKVSAYEVCKIINTEVDPTCFYFRQEALVSTMHHFKSYLSEKSFNNIEILNKGFRKTLIHINLHQYLGLLPILNP